MIPVTCRSGPAGGGALPARALFAWLVLLGSACLCVQPSAAEDRWVSETGLDLLAGPRLNPCTTRSLPCRSVQRALDAAENGDEVKIQQGVFTENVVLDRQLLDVTISGGWLAAGVQVEDPSRTAIDGDQQGPVFAIDAPDQPVRLSFENLQVRDGRATGAGGGISFVTDSIGLNRLTVRHVEFVSNQASAGGAIGVFADSEQKGTVIPFQIEISDSRFTGNAADRPPDGGGNRGGAIDITIIEHDVVAAIRRNEFEENGSANFGGAVAGWVYRDTLDSSRPGSLVLDLSQNTLVGGSAAEGGAAYFYAEGSGLLQISTRSNVVGGNTSGVSIDGNSTRAPLLDSVFDTFGGNEEAGLVVSHIARAQPNVTVHNGILWDNGPANDRNVVSTSSTVLQITSSILGGVATDGVLNQAGNLGSNPQFVDPAADDYHVRARSAAVDAAGDCTVAEDVDGEPRPDPVGGVCDLGADELTPLLVQDGQSSMLDEDLSALPGLDVLGLGCELASCADGYTETHVELAQDARVGPQVRVGAGGRLALRGAGAELVYVAEGGAVRIHGFDFEVGGEPAPFGPLGETAAVLTGQLETQGPIFLALTHAGRDEAWTGDVILDGPENYVLINSGASAPNPARIDDFSAADRLVAIRDAGCTGVMPTACGGSSPTVAVMEAGQVAELQTFDRTSLALRGGSVGGKLVANMTSVATLAGGVVGGDAIAFDGAELRSGQEGAHGRVIGDTIARGAARIELNDDISTGGIRAYDDSTIVVRSTRSPQPRAVLSQDVGSLVELHGWDFQRDGFPLPYGELTGSHVGMLTGVLAQSGPASFEYRMKGSQGAAGTIQLVEAGTRYVNTGGDVLEPCCDGEFQRVRVRNQGCTSDESTPCASATPTRAVLADGYLAGSQLQVYDASTLDARDPYVGGRLEAFDDAAIDVRGGRVVDAVLAHDASVVSLGGGFATALLSAGDSSTVTLQQVDLERSFSGSGSATLVLEPGALARGGGTVFGSANLVLRGGVVRGALSFGSNGTYTQESGSVSGGAARLAVSAGSAELRGGFVSRLEATSSSETTISDTALIGEIRVSSSAVVEVQGGTVDATMTSAAISGGGGSVVVGAGTVRNGAIESTRGRIEIRGGNLEPGVQLRAIQFGRIDVLGVDFAVDGQPVAFGPIAATSGQLSGVLASGEALDLPFQRTARAVIELVLMPEPGAPHLQLGAALALLALRRAWSGGCGAGRRR